MLLAAYRLAGAAWPNAVEVCAHAIDDALPVEAALSHLFASVRIEAVAKPDANGAVRRALAQPHSIATRRWNLRIVKLSGGWSADALASHLTRL